MIRYIQVGFKYPKHPSISEVIVLFNWRWELGEEGSEEERRRGGGGMRTGGIIDEMRKKNRKGGK